MTTATKMRTKLYVSTPITQAHACVLIENTKIVFPAWEKIRRLERLHCLTDFHLPFFPPSSSSPPQVQRPPPVWPPLSLQPLATAAAEHARAVGWRAIKAAGRRGNGGLDPLRERVRLRGRMEEVERPSRCSKFILNARGPWGVNMLIVL